MNATRLATSNEQGVHDLTPVAGACTTEGTAPTSFRENPDPAGVRDRTSEIVAFCDHSPTVFKADGDPHGNRIDEIMDDSPDCEHAKSPVIGTPKNLAGQRHQAVIQKGGPVTFFAGASRPTTSRS